jgi:ABC-2 type transport system permease protein
MFPYRGMPFWAQYLGEIFPLTHFLRLIRGVMLKGAEASTIAGSFVTLGGFAVVLGLAALFRFRRTID